MSLASLALIGRIVFLGIERIIVKSLGENADAASAAFLFFFIGALFICPVVLVEGSPMAAPPLGLFVAAFFYALAFVLYVRSLAEGEASLVSPLYYFNVFFLAVAAALFLGEALTMAKLLGCALLLYGSSWLKREGTLWRSLRAVAGNRPCQTMMAASLLIAIGRVIDKSLVTTMSPTHYAVLLYLAIAAFIFLYLWLRGRVPRIWALVSQRPSLAIACGAVNGYSYLCLLTAIVAYPVSVAEPLSMLGLLLTLLLSKLLLNEALGHRPIGALFMIAGAWALLA